MVLSPNSACFILKVPDPRPVPLELLKLRAARLGQGSHPQYPDPGFADPLLLRPPPALGSPWAGVGGRPQTPQRMRGAERSLVMVGRSFTVAKGFVPL